MILDDIIDIRWYDIRWCDIIDIRWYDIIDIRGYDIRIWYSSQLVVYCNNNIRVFKMKLRRNTCCLGAYLIPK
jgi:hypothetical protein